MDNYSFGKLQASFAIMRDQITILAYLADKFRKKEPISKEEHEIIREHCEYMKIFINDNKKYE